MSVPVRGSGPRRAPSGLTGRAAVLGMVVCALVLSLAYPVKQYIAQRGEIAQLEQDQQAVRDRVRALEAQQERLSDPTYLAAQARERLQYVMPGDTAYVVIDAGAEPEPEQDKPEVGRTLDAQLPWYDQLWTTVELADGGG